MHENFINEKCSVCSSTFFEGDDIVVCPECGAPYHRECYKHAGSCVYTAEHGEFEWKSEKNLLKEHFENIESAIIVKEEKESESPADFPDRIDMSNVHSFEEYKELMDEHLLKQEKDFPEVDGVTAEELIKFLNKNAYYYLPVFKAIATKGKIMKLNFAALLFFPMHCFYRRMNFLGTIVMTAYIICMEFCMIISSWAGENGINQQAVLSVGMFVGLALSLFVLMFFNYFYFKTAVKKIKNIKAENASMSKEEIFQLISAEGRPSLFNAVAFTMCIAIVASLAVKLINYNLIK